MGAIPPENPFDEPDPYEAIGPDGAPYEPPPWAHAGAGGELGTPPTIAFLDANRRVAAGAVHDPLEAVLLMQSALRRYRLTLQETPPPALPWPTWYLDRYSAALALAEQVLRLRGEVARALSAAELRERSAALDQDPTNPEAGLAPHLLRLAEAIERGDYRGLAL